MDKQTIHLITIILTIISFSAGSNAWMYNGLSGRISEVESRLSNRITEVENKLSDRITEVENKLSDRMTALEARVDGIDKRLVIVETSLKANNQYIARVLSQSKSGTPAKP